LAEDVIPKGPADVAWSVSSAEVGRQDGAGAVRALIVMKAINAVIRLYSKALTLFASRQTEAKRIGIPSGFHDSRVEPFGFKFLNRQAERHLDRRNTVIRSGNSPRPSSFRLERTHIWQLNGAPYSHTFESCERSVSGPGSRREAAQFSP